MNSDKSQKQLYKEMEDIFDSFSKEIEKMCDPTQLSVLWMDTKQICELFCIKQTTLNNYRKRGVLPFSRFGNKCYYKISDVDDFLNRNIKIKNYGGE